MTRSADDTHVVHEVLAAELGADARLLADLQHLLLPFEVAETAAALVARRGQLVEVTGRRFLDGREAHLGRCAADAEGQMVRRAGRRAEVFDMLGDELGQRLFVQKRLSLLIEEGLVGRTAALGNEKELVFHAGLAAVDVDLRGQIGAGVLLLGHGKRHDLRITQIALLVSLVNAAGDALGIVGPGKNVLALMADADGRAGILTGGQLALGRDALVEQHGISHELVVVGSLGVVEDVAQLLQVGRTQVERHVAVSRLGQQLQTGRIDLEDLTAVALDDLDVIFGQQTVLRFVLPHGERLLVDEFGHNTYNLCLY